MLAVVYWTGLFILFTICSQSAQTKEAEECFIYPVNETKDSPFCEGGDDGVLHVSINRVFGNESEILFLSEANDTFFFLNSSWNASSDKSDNHQGLFSNIDSIDITFRPTKKGIEVKIRDGRERDKLLETNPPQKLKLRIKSKDQINVIFNCPSGCMFFRKAVIHKSLEKSPSSFRIYGRIYNFSEYKTSLDIIHGNYLVSNKTIDFSDLKLDKTFGTRWFYFSISVSYGDLVNGPSFDFYKANFNVTKPSFINASLSGNHLDEEYIHLRSKDLYLDFRKSEHVSWTINCHPEDPSSQLQGDASPNPTVIVLSCVCAVFFILVAVLLGIVVCKRRRHSEPSCLPASASGEEVIVPQVDPVEEHEYEYIDLEVLQRELERERGPRSQDEGVAQAAREVEDGNSSHTSVNSLYKGLDAERASSSSEGSDQRSSRHSTVNSIYGRGSVSSNVTEENSRISSPSAD